LPKAQRTPYDEGGDSLHAQPKLAKRLPGRHHHRLRPQNRPIRALPDDRVLFDKAHLPVHGSPIWTGRDDAWQAFKKSLPHEVLADLSGDAATVEEWVGHDTGQA
jgi:hypothetical protein